MRKPQEVTEQKVQIESAGEMLSFEPDRGTFDLINTDTGLALFSGASPGYNGMTASGQVMTCEKLNRGFLFTTLYEKEQVELKMRVTRHRQKRVFIFDTWLKNLSENVIHITSISPLTLSRDRGGFLFLRTISIFCNGYHSWEKSGVCRVARDSNRSVVSHCLTAFEDRSQSLGMLMAFTGFRRALSQICFEYDRGCKSLAALCLFDGIPVDPGRIVRGERFALSVTRSGQEALELWVELAAQEMHPRTARAPMAGWCSWYQAYEQIDEKYILRNLARAGETGCLSYFQVDDGYQQSEGDWLVGNEKFPSPMPHLMKSIGDQGLMAGIWVAPFMVHPDSALFHDHPDWLIRDAWHGPLPLIEWRRGPMYGLDCSHPEALQWLRDMFTVMRREWNVSLFKLDFLYLAAAPGKRYNKRWTGAQCYRAGLETIREALGEDAFILTCGALLGQSIGIADAMRISGDVAARWHGDLSASTSIMNTMTRYFTHRQLWINDPDALILRDDETGLSYEEVLTLVTVAGMSGGMVHTGDDLTRLTPERLSLMKKIIPSFEQGAIPLNLFTSGAPDILDLRIEKPFGAWHVVALLNLLDHPADRVFDLSMIGMRKEEYLVFDFWQNSFMGISKGEIVLPSIPAHGTRLLCVRACHGHPQLVSTDLHITQGGVEIMEYGWASRERILAMEICSDIHRQATLLFFLPGSYKLDHIESTADSWAEMIRSDGLLEVTSQFSATFELKLHFSREQGQ